MKEKYYITEIAFNRAINVTHSFFFLFISYFPTLFKQYSTLHSIAKFNAKQQGK